MDVKPIRITDKTYMSMMILIELAQALRPMSVRTLSKMTNISESYSEQFMRKLLSFNIVKSVRGPGGGYTLAKSPADIYLLQIISSSNWKPKSIAGNEIYFNKLSVALGESMRNVTLQCLIDNIDSQDVDS